MFQTPTLIAQLLGGPGQDGLIGEIGYFVRRLDTDGCPVLLNAGDGAVGANTRRLSSSARGSWQKDIVLEELGWVTKTQRISQNAANGIIDAAGFSTSSIVFVAPAYNENGKYTESRISCPTFDGTQQPCAPEWVTEVRIQL